MNHTMTVYNPDGSRYFHTDTVSPERETREENFWVVQGYVVVFTESATAQATKEANQDYRPIEDTFCARR